MVHHKRRIVSAVLSCFCLAAPVQAADGFHLFLDMKGSFAENAVTFLYEKGIIEGVGNQQFAPNQTIERKHFAVMLAKSLGIQPILGTEATFEDIPPESPEYGYIEALVKMNAIKGTNQTQFGGEQPITREDAAVILQNVLPENGQATVPNSTGYKDQGQISPYALQAVGFVSWNSIMKGSNGAFYPKRKLTRAEASIIAQQIYEKVTRHAAVNDWLYEPDRISLKTGQSTQIRLTPPKGSLSFSPVWGIDNPEIGAISHDGTFTAMKPGKGIITLNIGYKTYKISVEVAESL